MREMHGTFRGAVLSGRKLFGTFLKIPATMPAEILGSVGYDFVVIDEEHAPFNRETTDRIILACRAWGLGAVVRVQSADPAALLSVLDCGADGILVPHVKDVETARAVVSAARYATGTRGFSPTTRAGTFGGTSAADHVAQQDGRVLVIAMIEDPEALEVIDDILAVEGLDAVFVGRGDLASAYRDLSGQTGAVAQATAKIQASARAAGKVVAILPSTPEDAQARAQEGASMFILSSDQGFLRSAAIGVREKFETALSSGKGE